MAIYRWGLRTMLGNLVPGIESFRVGRRCDIASYTYRISSLAPGPTPFIHRFSLTINMDAQVQCSGVGRYF